VKLSFELTKEGTLEVFFDVEGRNLLIRSLQRMQEPGDHDHLMTPAWGSHELSEETHHDNRLIHMVTLGIPREQL
jgi:hypothetical protein